MAPIPAFEWKIHDYHDYLGSVPQHLYTLLCYTGIYILISLCIVTIGLILRFLRIKFGGRIQPDRRKAVLITGATAGIGLVIAKHFYKLGFSVIACYYNDQEPGYIELLEYGNKSYEDICKKKKRNIQAPGLFLVRMDVRSRESIANSAQEIFALLDKNDIELHYLINNAGISRDGPFEWCSRESMKDLIDTNLTGVLMVTREFILDIILNKGRVINVSSGIYLTPGPDISVYGGSKSAIAYFSASLDRDMKKYGASSVCVMPGNFISTSSIIYPRIRTYQESEKKLSEKERSVYNKSIQEYSRNMNRLLEIKLETSGDDPVQMASLFKFDLPDFASVKRRSGCFTRFIQWYVGLLDGSVSSGQTLEESGVLSGYENAVCLKHPPQSIYAGGFLYAYFFGPFMEYIPRVALGPITWMLIKGVRKD